MFCVRVGAGGAHTGAYGGALASKGSEDRRERPEPAGESRALRSENELNELRVRAVHSTVVLRRPSMPSDAGPQRSRPVLPRFRRQTIRAPAMVIRARGRSAAAERRSGDCNIRLDLASLLRMHDIERQSEGRCRMVHMHPPLSLHTPDLCPDIGQPRSY
ncbi:hypothetical protein BC628DRAFT_1186216 [Trametes gibbosa]|nr:hypothetical protein BC628DRAFT_1186216 [Trametes gibbosa]